MTVTGRHIGSAFLVLFLSFALLVPVTTRAESVVEIDNLKAHDLRSLPFTVTRTGRVRIEAVGGEHRSISGMFAYPWLINARSRSLIWSMDDEITDESDESEWLRTYDDHIRLHPGSYILYYYSGPTTLLFSRDGFDSYSDFWDEIEKLIDRVKESQDKETGRLKIETEDLEREYFVRITGAEGLLKTGRRSEYGRKPVIALTRPDNDSYEKVSFTVSEATVTEIYAIGEYWSPGGAMADWGWIANAATGERIWEMSEDNTDHAGGDEKNRRFRGRVTIPAGSYTACFVTDGSHTYDGWNSAPPYDPEAWGLQVFTVSDDDADHLVLNTAAAKPTTMIRLEGVGDNELLSGAFRLMQPCKVRIYALGEYDRYGDRMADYAWIVSADKNKKVWEMTGENTMPAGGAAKNRQYDGVVALAPGEYLVWYVSDGSHSYADGWNDSPPFDQKAYGITLSVADQSVGPRTFEILDPEELRHRGALVELTGLGNGEEVRRRFTLKSLSRIRIHALGEGSYHDMADYGWIENAGTGDIVWEMTYRKTSHAGGAEKNRLVDQTILLDKGEYIVYYVTDGSHAFGNWNAAPPDEPTGWGILLTKSERE